MGEAQDHIVRTVRAAMKEQDTESREKKEEQKSKERVADQIDKAIRTVMKDYDIKAKNHKQKLEPLTVAGHACCWRGLSSARSPRWYSR